MAHLILSRSSDEPFYRISYSTKSKGWSSINPHPKLPPEKCIAMCSGNGLVCYWGKYYVIWNPSTDEYQSIPLNDSCNLPCVCSSEEHRMIPSGFVEGLGFVPESHDYKLVTFITSDHDYYEDNYEDSDDDDDDDDEIHHASSDHVAVYSSKTSSWKELPFPFHFQDISPKYFGASACVNGFVYWITRMDAILSFDLSTDKFSTLPCPDDIPSDFNWKGDNQYVHLLEVDGSLCLVIQFVIQLPTTKQKLLNFWVYAASSTSSSPWTRKINLDARLDAAVADIPLWLGKKYNGGEFLLLRGFDGSLREYDYTTKKMKSMFLIPPYPTRGMSSIYNNMIISPYVATNANIAMNKGGNGDIVDRISQLPDDMIVHILSFLSLKEAASTTVLSTRWSDLWRHTPKLNFHAADVDTDMYVKWVDSVVEKHIALSLIEFSISFPMCYRTSSTAIKWLEFAFSRRVEVLELNFLGGRFNFLEEFLQKSTIMKLTNLRSLCLKCLKVSGSDIGLFLRNCPLLERLIIKSAALTSDLEVCGSALKHLDIQHCQGGKSIKGYAPNLTSLRIDSAPFSLYNVDDHLNLAWATRQSADEPPLFPFISSQLTTLEFTLNFPPKGFFGNRFHQVLTLRELIVTYLGGHGIRPITSLICAFPYLEEFEIKCFRRIQEHTRSPIEGPGVDVVNNVERFCHRHLRVFKFTWFDVGDGDHMELMSYILDNCVGLQKIILDIYGADSPSYDAAWEYAKQLQSKLLTLTHIQLIVSFNNRQLV